MACFVQCAGFLAAKTGQRIDESRFANIGATEKADLWHASIYGEVEKAWGRVEEFRAAEERIGSKEVGFGWERGARCG